MGDKAINGRIAYIASQVDADTRTLSVRISMTSEQGFSVGTFVEVDITPVASAWGEKEAKIVAVPREAIFTVGGGTVVLVADDDHQSTYAMRKVAAAPPLVSLVPIISGVEDDDEVVNQGGFIIKAEFATSAAT